MESNKELMKLVNVLRRTARMAMHSEWIGSSKDAAAFCVDKYNRVLARLKELDEAVGRVFEPLPAESSLHVTAMACRQLAAYYEDDIGPAPRFRGGAYAIGLDPEAFKEFWRKSGRDIEDLGEFIRESIGEWMRNRGRHACGPRHRPEHHEQRAEHEGHEPPTEGAKP